MATIKVVFRVFDGEVLALFPELPGTNDRWTCTCYAHIGQHSSADIHHVVNNSRPATVEEYFDLLRELEGIYCTDGDTLRVVRRVGKWAITAREEELRAQGYKI